MSRRILICDDELHILRAAEFKFKREGFDVDTASDGEDAWERILQHKPDILITDCQMPRLDGIGLTQRIRAHATTADLPVVMLTAKGYELSREEMCVKHGILAVLAKPFSPRELVRMTEQILATGRYEEPSLTCV